MTYIMDISLESLQSPTATRLASGKPVQDFRIIQYVGNVLQCQHIPYSYK